MALDFIRMARVAYLVLTLLSEGGHLLDEVTMKALEELVDLLEGRFH